MENGSVSASDWFKGIALSVLASIIGGGSKLAIRKSWIIQHEEEESFRGEPRSDNAQSLTSNIHCERLADVDVDVDPLASPEDSIDDDRSRWYPYFLRYIGMFGMSVLNPICCVLAMNYASPSILAPFSGLTLVWVILLSKPALGEKPSYPQVVAACLIIMGEVIVAVFGDHTNDDGVTVEFVKKSYKDPMFLCYLIGLALYVMLLVYWICFSKSPILRRFAWGSCGGVITGLQNFLKDSLTIHKATPHDGSYPWCFFLFAFLAAASAFIGLLMLTACMKRYDATYSAASFVGSFVVSASIMSAAHYNTFALLETVWNYILYPVGLLVLILGVFILVRESREAGEEDDSEFQGPERKDSEDSQLPFVYTQVEEDTDTTVETASERVV